jgi:FlaA1/EpsC-like NDP-sugar epimerase
MRPTRHTTGAPESEIDDVEGPAALNVIPATMLRWRLWFVVGINLVLIPLGYLAAYALRFDFSIPPKYLAVWLNTLPFLLTSRLAVFWGFGLHKGWWRHVGLYELVALLQAATVSALLFVGLLMVSGQLSSVPRSIFVLDWLLAILVFGGSRLAIRWFRERVVRLAAKNGSGKRALIVGAGDAAARLLREVRVDASSGLSPIGILDPDPRVNGYRIHGVPVLGTPESLPSLAHQHRIQLVVVATPQVSREQMRQLTQQCAALGLEFKIVPPLGELLDGRARLSQLRAVDIGDLLGREPVQLDLRVVEASLSGRTVLITGGAGSIGSELARQVATYGATRIILVDKSESPLYFIHLELKRSHPDIEVVPCIADVTDARRVEEFMGAFRPQVVFHAAAYKHVPLMEQHVAEAVRNNVMGTLHVAHAAVTHGVTDFVLISTDKAVHPSSVMGATKRVAERIILGLGRLRESGTNFRAVRFGNVLGSDGSVVPLFRRQIDAGGPVTVTHADVARYFMTIPEAVQLVLQASAIPDAAGRIAMLDMGEPVRIVDLAENLIRLSGYEPYTEMPIVFTGLRPGEKMFEELQSYLEDSVPTAFEKIRILQGLEEHTLRGARSVEHGLAQLDTALAGNATMTLLDALRLLVPECVSPLRERIGTVDELHPTTRAQRIAAPSMSIAS